MNDFRFYFGKYWELHEARYNDISVEALLFDAYKNENLSIIEIFDYYLTFESNLQNKADKLQEQADNSQEKTNTLQEQADRAQKNANIEQKNIYKPIKDFIFCRLKLLINDNIQPNELLNPSGGKQMKRFHPPTNRGSFIQGVQDIKCFTKDTNKEALINTNKVFNKDIKFKLFEYDQTIYNERKAKLKNVEILLKRFYLTEESYIDKRHMEEQQYIIHDKLTKLYEDKSKSPQR